MWLISWVWLGNPSRAAIIELHLGVCTTAKGVWLRETTMKLALAFVCAILLTVSTVQRRQASPPNIIFLLTDDQDVTANSLDYMPKLDKILRQEGTEFLNYFVTTALCCPSRSTIIRGQYCHNTGIWDNGDLNNDTFLSGGYKKWVANNLDKSTIATMMHAAGYETFLVGKYLNGYSDQHAGDVPPGWDHWHGMTDMAYFGPHFSDQGKLLKLPKSVYQTDYISETTLTWLRQRDTSKPFFFYVAPFAPHAPSLPAPRHANLFNDKKAPRYDSFNPDDSIQHEKPSWLATLPKLTDKQIGSIDEFYRNRLRALQAVDEMLENITQYLDKENLLENTYIFYMGDNGQHLGDYRLPAGKRQAYDTDIRVPFLVRGPNVKGGAKVTEIVQNIDLMPTWVDLASSTIPSTYVTDGKSIRTLLEGTQEPQPHINTFHPVSLAEMYGGSSNMGEEYRNMNDFEKNRFWNNTYQAIRVINGSDWAEGVNWLYTEWCTGEKELYDTTKDPRQIRNIAHLVPSSTTTLLSALIDKLGSCSGHECHSLDLYRLRRDVEDERILVPNRRLPCHNPPDLPGRGGEPLLRQAVLGGWPVTTAMCKKVVGDGLPYADNDAVPDEELSLWDTCLSMF